MGFPKDVVIYEVGPREGTQIEEKLLSAAVKIELVHRLSETGLRSIEVTSFVSPKWVPQMADADEVLAKIKRVGNVSYRCVYLNQKGLERASRHEVTLDGVLMITASHTFSQKNTNKGIAETFSDVPSWIRAYQNLGIPADQVLVMAAFGCNYEGVIGLPHVMDILQKMIRLAEEHGEKIKKIKLADTMGWTNPEQIKRTIYAVKNKWPEVEIILHLHDTRGLGLANAYAALQEGVSHFESAIGGLGGCPYAAVKGAAGNVATEDLAFLCMEMGIKTGIHLEKLLDCVRFAEKIFGHSLPGHLARGGLLQK